MRRATRSISASSGDKTQNVLWRLNNMDVQNLKPKVAVVLIGTNNTANNAHEIADGVKAVLANTQETFPGVKIILVSILPNDARQRQNDAGQLDHPELRRRQHRLLSRSRSADAARSRPPDPDGKIDTNWKGLGKDHLHPDATGYQIWADAMEPLLTKLLAGRSRSLDWPLHFPGDVTVRRTTFCFKTGFRIMTKSKMLAGCLGWLILGLSRRLRPAGHRAWRRVPTNAVTAPAPTAQLPEPMSATVPDNTRYLNKPSLLKAMRRAGGRDQRQGVRS